MGKFLSCCKEASDNGKAICPICENELQNTQLKKCGCPKGYRCCCNVRNDYELGTYDLVEEMRLQNPYR